MTTPSKTKRRVLYRLDRVFTLYLPLLLFCAFILLPIFFAVFTSLKSYSEIMTASSFFPVNPTLENFEKLLVSGRFTIYIKNSLFVSCISCAVVLVLSTLNAYAMCRFRFAGRQGFLMMLLATQLLPIVMLLIPLLIIFKKIGLTDSLWALILFNIVIQTPFNSTLMKGFLEAVPYSLEEAGMIDGANRFQILSRIVIPMMVPGIVATTAFAFIGCWNEFTVAYIFTNAGAHFTVPVGLSTLIGEYSSDYGQLAAGALIGLLPPLILFAYIQKFLVQGLSAGAVKG